MKSVAIRTEGLSKQYRVGVRREAYATLSETVTRALTAPARRLTRWARGQRAPRDDHTIWALRDVTCEIARGSVTGVIGRNGAGKSTLLKILARITAPTRGAADVCGRVGSLIEVGTGFHAELTGRENVYLNGALLGMRRAEIRRKFDEIVAFAEVEEFIDTPVKRYSSGMHMRLAFGVAAHLDPEILLVDEVLAVGDVKFQQRCLGKIEDVAHHGRTVLFVSHNMSAVRSLCGQGVVLDGGRLIHMGAVGDCIQHYYRAIGVLPAASDDRAKASDSQAVFGRVALEGKAGNTIHQSESARIATTLRVSKAVAGFSICCIVADSHGRWILRVDEDSGGLGLPSPLSGSYPLRVDLPPLWLTPGVYSVTFAVVFRGEYEQSFQHFSDAFPLDVAGVSPRRETVIHPPVVWSAGRVEPAERHASTQGGDGCP